MFVRERAEMYLDALGRPNDPPTPSPVGASSIRRSVPEASVSRAESEFENAGGGRSGVEPQPA